MDSPSSSGTQSPATPITPSEPQVTDAYAFAFDIDGVLVRGGKAIPAALEAMKMLDGANDYGVKVPYIFLTNGGGKSEAERCEQLSKQLESDIRPAQFICGHTPFGEMVAKYKTVLVVGGEGEKCRHVAESYGFQDVVTPGDLIKDNPHTTPFRQLSESELSSSRVRNYGEIEIEAILVFADSRDWGGDLQIIMDLLTSQHGRLGTRSQHYDESPPPIFFSHNDVLWSAGHEHTRLGMGALRQIIESTFASVTGRPLQTHAFGKPQASVFQFANRFMQKWRSDNYGINAPPGTVYFIGDTPSSDIRGTNEFDASDACANEWYSILVETGVYKAGTKPDFEAKATVANVLEAVKHGMEREHRKREGVKKALVEMDAGVPTAVETVEVV